jgi:hypothetical protein
MDINLIISEVNNYIHFLDSATKDLDTEQLFGNKLRKAYTDYVNDLKQRWVK